jgi:glycosyltransferase involved in cell wall biosynthesis
MRACIVSPAVPPIVGGSETLAANACLALGRRGVAVHLVTGSEVSHALAAAVAGAGGTVTEVHRARRDEELQWEYDEFYRAAAVHSVVSAHPVDVVHAFSHDAAIAAAAALGGDGTTGLAASFSELATESSEFGLARSAFVHRLPRIDAFLAPSEHYGELARGHGADPAKVRVMTAGVRTEAMAGGDGPAGRRRLGLEPGVALIACPSRFTPRKSQDVLLEAHAALLESGARAVLVLAGTTNSGDAGFLRALRERAGALGTAASVRFVEDLGQDEVPDLLAASDLVVQPSRREGLGLLAIEAMAAGAPVILTGIEGFSEFAVDGANCAVVPPGDPPALAAAMARLLRDPAARSRLAEGGRATAARYSLDRMADSLLDAYAGIARSRTASPARPLA